MHIRPEQASDHSAIHAVHAASFPSPYEASLVDALRAADKLSISLVAEVDGKVVGHVAFSPVTVNEKKIGFGLAPVAVIHSHRRKGIAEQLIREGLAACTKLDCGFVVVLGDPQYYQRFGFLPASRWRMTDPYGGGDAFQAMELSEGAIPEVAGIVRHAIEFDNLAEEDAD
ncbi:MAG: GNAT family N-acetyltransferase [Planctomycetota bacterium]|jgi:putative acetyltransferase